jgi:hypothetical protein
MKICFLRKNPFFQDKVSYQQKINKKYHKKNKKDQIEQVFFFNRTQMNNKIILHLKRKQIKKLSKKDNKCNLLKKRVNKRSQIL